MNIRKHRLASAIAFALMLHASPHALSAAAEGLTLMHVGDQESWLLSAAGNTRDVAGNALSFYGGVDRLAQVIANERTAIGATRSVLTLNAGDAFLPGARLNASFANLGSAYLGGQDFYDARAMRMIGFDAAVFGNHEFDLGASTAASFARASGTTYLSANLDLNSSVGGSSFASLAGGMVAPSKVITTAAGNRIGLIGVTTPLLPRISSPGAVGLLGYSPAASDAQNLQSLVPLLQAQINDLRGNQGATTIVLMSHLQNAANEIGTVVPQLAGIDIVLSGGGHELMAGASDPLLPGDVRAFTSYPQAVGTAIAGQQALVVTSNFGNRYVGRLDVQLGADGSVVRDASGIPVTGSDSRMIRVSGLGTDLDRVTGDAAVYQDVVVPVAAYVGALNGQIIGTSQVALNGARGAAGAMPGSFTVGVRNAETNLGNLVADAILSAAGGGARIALQNGGGIRASIDQGDISRGETATTLPFSNIVVNVPDVTPEKLKALLEHGYGGAATSPLGGAEGRFPQIAGMRVVYDSGRPAGSRVVSITLDDGTKLVEGGIVVAGAPALTLATIDFLARGGDGYPFQALGLTLENGVNYVTYGEALDRFIELPATQGGLGGVVTASLYGPENVLDFQGRQIDIAIAVPEPETYALMLAGIALVGWAARRRVRRA